MTGSRGAGTGGRRAARGQIPAKGQGRAAARARKGKRDPKRMFAMVSIAVAVLLVAGIGALYLKLNGNITTFDANGLSKDRPADTAGQNVLLIGSDSRANGNDALGGAAGDVAHSDTTILLHVYSDNKHAVGVSIPRDSMVDIPPCLMPDGKWTADQPTGQFNTAFTQGNSSVGNPACTQNTVEKLTGLRVDHTMVVDFKGFAAMTSAVGGVPVCLPNAVYQGDMNPNLGHKGNMVLPKGLQTVSGDKALDYVRIRHGIGDNSDIGRMKRQQAFLSALIKKIQGQGFNPTTLLPLADAATKSLTVDPGLGSASKLMSFAMGLKGIDLHNIKFITAPWRYAGNRVALVHPDVDSLWASLKADRTLDGQDASGGKKPAPAASASATAASDVTGTGIVVAVYNGTTDPGLASKAAQKLRSDNFTVTGTATAASQHHATTVIEYGAAHLQGAQTLAKLFPGAQLEQTATSGINLVLGQDYAANASGSSAGSSSGSSPAPSALPSQDASQARSADDNPCSNLSYG
ncbi:LCP family protein [Streptantibioticus ferralitis]|uniref:LCP family protein n=1 Tax=Streptantibioticus ferralitis TaxID=236510 RepID=A0ABT5Z7J1_9ACTN|nr:LCP family protein [Streptantibioticus ferralitis]MDF2259797.1 LCP family protein [Streptantibioticus ferralitis]